MRNQVRMLFFIIALVPGYVLADGLVSESDAVAGVAAGLKGKKVTPRLKSGQELTGAARTVGKSLVALGELSGKEYFVTAVSQQ